MKKIFSKIASKIVLYAVFAGMLASSGCINDRFASANNSTPISFKSSIGRLSQETHDTRVVDTDWHSSDRIGVYMIAGGGTIADNSLGVNVMHRHAGNGNFEAEPDGELFYPRTGEVDFVAYYPWRSTFDDHRYPIDVADQSDLPAIDFIYSDNATGHSAGEVPLLRFHHMLSKLIFEVTDLTGGSLGNLSAVITGLKTSGIFDLSEGYLSTDTGSGGAISPARTDDGNDTTARLEAIVLPGAAISPVVDFSLSDGTVARLNLPDAIYLGSKAYIYNVTITAPGKVVLTGGTVITDWEDRDREPEEYQIPKADPNDGGNDPGKIDDDGGGEDGGDDADSGDNPDTPPGERVRYFLETVGNIGPANARRKINDYTGWDNASVSYVDRFGNADICGHDELDTHIYFPAAKEVDITVSGLPAGYTDITLSYDIAAEAGDSTPACRVMVYVGGENLTSEVTAIIPSPNRYVRISIDIPPGATSLRFVNDTAGNTAGMRLDNISLEGTR